MPINNFAWNNLNIWNILKHIREKYDLVIVCPDIGDGGAQRVLSILVGKWASDGLKICIVTLFNKNRASYVFNETVTLIHLDEENNSISKNYRYFPLRVMSWFLRMFLRKLPKTKLAFQLIKLNKVIENLPNILCLRKVVKDTQTSSLVSFFPSANVVSILSIIGLKVRVSVCERNDSSRKPEDIAWDLLRRHLYAKADVVAANSEGELKNLEKFVPSEKLFFLPNPVLPKPERDLSYAFRQDQPHKIILSVGRLVRQKNQEFLLRSFALCHTEIPDWHVYIAGRGELAEEYKRIAKSLEIEDKIHWVGHISDIETLYSKANIFVLNSNFEGTPNALLEAMHAELPCIVSKSSPGITETIKDGQNGRLYEVGNITEFVEKLLELTQSQEFRQNLGKAARLTAAKNNLEDVLPLWNKALGIENK